MVWEGDTEAVLVIMMIKDEVVEEDRMTMMISLALEKGLRDAGKGAKIGEEVTFQETYALAEVEVEVKYGSKYGTSRSRIFRANVSSNRCATK